MSTRNSALASLTATYTDSENEDNNHSDEGSPGTDSSTESQVIFPAPQNKKSFTPTKTTPEHVAEHSRANSANNSVRLVNYVDDTIVSDEETVSPTHEVLNMEVSEDERESIKDSPKHIMNLNKYAHYGFTLPPEPKGKVAPELQEKILSLYEKMKTGNMDMNKVIQERKEFRNPSIYEKLIQFCDINELGTNYPPENYDPLQWGPESYYEELAKAQKIEIVKRQKEKKETEKTEQAVAAKKSEEEAKKRKSKWDQPAAVVNSNLKTNIPPPSLTSNVTGTKGTVISAFGSLPKKVNL